MYSGSRTLAALRIWNTCNKACTGSLVFPCMSAPERTRSEACAVSVSNWASKLASAAKRDSRFRQRFGGLSRNDPRSHTACSTPTTCCAMPSRLTGGPTNPLMALIEAFCDSCPTSRIRLVSLPPKRTSAPLTPFVCCSITQLAASSSRYPRVPMALRPRLALRRCAMAVRETTTRRLDPNKDAP